MKNVILLALCGAAACFAVACGGADGDGDDGQGGAISGSCRGILDCMTACGNDLGCMEACIEGGSAQGQADIDALFSCTDANECGDQACVDEFCAEEAAACEAGGNGGTGGSGGNGGTGGTGGSGGGAGGSGGTGGTPADDGLTCSEVWGCVLECSDDDCANACYEEGSEEGVSLFFDVLDCMAENECETGECLEENCGPQIEACFVSGIGG